MKPSRLQLRLEDGIRNARSTFEADCLRAERAGLLARIGQFDEVRIELAALHERYDPRPNAEISAWLNLVEGLTIFSEDMGHAASDKIRRAHALSRVAGLVRLRALSAAWLAHMDFLKADIDAMSINLSEALSFADKSNLSTLGRANLVIAQGYHQGGRLDLALPWYFSARDSAISEGDDATISALMHNMAWLRASNLRQAQIFGVNIIKEDDHSLMSAQSTANYDLLAGVVSLNAHVPILRAKLLTMKGKPAEALILFDEYLKTAVTEGLSRLQADLIADRAWCKIQLGQRDAAKEDAAIAESTINPIGQFDDRAFAHSRLVEVFSALGELKSVALHKKLAETAWHGYNNFQRRIIDALDSIVVKTQK
ncbi:MAG: hypothetical protein Q8R33_17860 [Burkholderiales bacterium]|nr:hypothetical protein [Burkholderiales bacterium]